MQRYQYKHGDRPLEGYTIQRAAGRGGFGEVYFAISDSGREVALKVVQNYEQIELRGITQCQNLKNPHLVTVFDVKYNERQEPFVIMEFVSGPSLHDLLAESPNGLGPQKAAFFLREIAKGLSFLHECGIVHRDLKPGNIFYENGYVKIGDYGLTKAISASRHSGQTITVGTVHYMAPEIGAGKYDRSIDIYALGVLLFEMLTGEVPFAGSSPGEILMKHMATEPDLKGIDEPFAHVIKKALQKDPADRYQTVQEMVEDLYGYENIRNSVSAFSPDDLSIIAQQVAAKANIGQQGDTDKNQAAQAGAKVGGPVVGKAQHLAQQADDFGQKVAGRMDAETDKFLKSRVRIPGVTDAVDPRQRRTLAFMSMVIVAIGAGVLQGEGIVATALAVFIMTLVCSKVILLSLRRWFVDVEPESRWVTRLLTCVIAATLASLVPAVVGMAGVSHGNGPRFAFGFLRHPFLRNWPGGFFWLSLALPMLLVDWWRISSPQRSKRLSLGSAVWIGFLGLVSSAIFGGAGIMVASILAGTSLVVQAQSAFGSVTEVAPARRRRGSRFHKSLTGGRVPSGVRIGWLIGFFISLSVGLTMLIWAGMERMTRDEYAAAVSVGIDSLILAVFCFVGACRQRFNGWYRYIIKPGILLVCILTIVASSVCLIHLSLSSDESLICLILIIIPAVAFLIIAFLPARIFDFKGHDEPAKPKPASASAAIKMGVSPYKRMWALILAAGGLFGFNGLHRFYVGKIGTGILWFLTGGLLGIGQLIDVVLIIVGQFTDHEGRPLEIWQDETEEAYISDVRAAAVEPSTMPLVPEASKDGDGKQDVAEAKQGPPPFPVAPERPASAPVRQVFTSTALFERFHPFAFLLSGVGFILTFVAIIVGLAMALHVPHFVAAGWPDRGLAMEMENLFGYPEWPGLMMSLGMMLSVVLMLVAAVCIIMGRRHLGARHLLRAVFGLGGFICAILWLADGIGWRFDREISELLGSDQAGPAFEALLRALSSGYGVFPMLTFLASVVILAWPPRRKKETMLNPALDQGAF